MLDNPYLLALFIIIAAGVVIYAVRSGYNVKLKSGDHEASFESNSTSADESGISVGDGLEINGEVGNVTGVKATEGATNTDSIDVLKNAKIGSGAKVGDITGADLSSPTDNSNH